jgi:subtilase family serine protease
MSMRKTQFVAVGSAAAAVLAIAVTATGSATAAPAARAVAHSKPAWVSHAKSLGKATGTVKARVYFEPKGGLNALEAAATAMATPGSATYHQFLTEPQYVTKYAPTAATVSAMSKYLKKSGLTVTSVGAANRFVAFSGPARAANQAFSTKIVRYRHLGHIVSAPSTTLKVPAKLAGSVLTITGLDSTPHAELPLAAPPAGFRNAHPCSTFYGQVAATTKADFATPLPQFEDKTLDYAPCGYTGPQLRAAYEGNTNLDGSGTTVAIVDAYAAPSIASDAEHYADVNGDGDYLPGQLVQTTQTKYNHQPACGPSGWYGEESLDVEAVHAMAPGANIHYYGAASCFDNDFLDALTKVDTDDTAQIVTNSWGSPIEAEGTDQITAYESVFLQGAVQGISFMFSSGDNGDELANTAIKQSDYPTSDPFVTSVGGTSTAIDGNGNLASETAWGTEKYTLSSAGTAWVDAGFLYGSGGGAAALFNKPTYQAGISNSPYREVPDVAMDADPNTGMLIGETQTFPEGKHYDQYRIGGTSLASPLFAGLTALAIQHGGTAVGLLNPTIYGHPTDFTDVRPKPSEPIGDVRVDYSNGLDAAGGLAYSVRTFGQDGSLVSHGGYDESTGLGSPNTDWLTVVAPGCGAAQVARVADC